MIDVDKRMKLSPTIVALSLLLVSCSEHIIQYDEYLPPDATEVRLEKLRMGIDYAYYMKAKVDIDGFEAFKRRMELKPATQHFTPYKPDEVSAWWNPVEKNEVFVREEYSEHSPDVISNLYWVTHEDGYLFFNHTNF
jgi:hypothetical protein